MKRRITLPQPGTRKNHARPKRVVSRKRAPTPVRLDAVWENDEERLMLPTLVFARRYPSLRWVVPAVKIPLYWFDRVMVQKGLITSIPPDTFIVDGRRFKVLCQDFKEYRRGGYTRWLCYEEKAVGKGEKP